MNNSEITFRCSSLGDLMSDGRGASRADKLAKKRVEIRELAEKIAADNVANKAHLKTSIARVDKMQALEAELDELTHTADTPENVLGDTAKSRCRAVVLSEIYGGWEEVESDATRHGKQWESVAISQFGEMIWANHPRKHGRFNKNFKRETMQLGTTQSPFFLTGEPDVVYDNTIFEFKCPFSIASYEAQTRHPIADYILQVHGYMLLFGLDKAAIITALFANKNIKTDKIFLNTPRNLRYHTLPVERDDDLIAQIYDRLTLCAQYARDFRDGFRNNAGFYRYKDYRQTALEL